jgi:aerobic carbon-monoxide dehydrogenase medium subunit
VADVTVDATLPEVRRAASVDDAVAQLAALGDDAAALAGATWIMRARHRGEPLRPCYLALAGLDELREVVLAADEAQLGAMVTHADIAGLAAPRALAGLVTAAAQSAFPAVRSVATLGGNLCARRFAEADLVPPLLAAEARVTVRSSTGAQELDVEAFLASRDARPPGELLVGVRVPVAAHRRSGFERLTVRGAGEYAVASVAVSLDVVDGVVEAARVAVGSVEELPRLCASASEALVGFPVDAQVATDAGRAAASECDGRDGLDAPGWYREAVLPALVRRAVMQVSDERSAR